MRKNFDAKPILYFQPIFIIATYNANGSANAMDIGTGNINALSL